MKKTKYVLSIIVLIFWTRASFSQTTNSLIVYPNPFNISATIHFEIIQSDTITLRLINLVGQTLKTFYQSTILPQGSYNVDLIGDSLANGMYFIQLGIGTTKNITQKVIKIDENTGLSGVKPTGNILVYPNPTKGEITISIAGNKTIIITDLEGKSIKTFTTDQQAISLLDIAVGQYLITILSNKKEVILKQKLIKIE